MTEIIKTEAGIPYYDEQMGQTKQEITDLIRLLLRQTFLLERKYDKKTGRFQYTKEYRSCSLHLEFIRRYFASPALRFWKQPYGDDLYPGRRSGG